MINMFLLISNYNNETITKNQPQIVYHVSSLKTYLCQKIIIPYRIL